LCPRAPSNGAPGKSIRRARPTEKQRDKLPHAVFFLASERVFKIDFAGLSRMELMRLLIKKRVLLNVEGKLREIL